MNVAFFAYYFPPTGGAGTQRSSKLAKYLSGFGMTVSVYTTKEDKERGKWEPLDHTMMKDIQNVHRVYRVSCQGKDLDCWINEAYKLFEKNIHTDRYDVVVITLSPFECAKILQRIQNDHKVPVVLDLRDPWALDGWRKYKSIISWVYDYIKMKKALLTASGAVFNTQESKEIICNRFNLDKSRYIVCTNGFDADDFSKSNDHHKLIFNQDRFKEKKIKIVHTGYFHLDFLNNNRSIALKLKQLLEFRPEKIKIQGRSPLTLFRAIRNLKNNNTSKIEQIEFHFAGYKDERMIDLIRKFKLSNQCIIHGYLSHHDSINLLLDADALFLPLHDLPTGHKSRIVPGKLYEYLAANKPILGGLPEGDAREFVKQFSENLLTGPLDVKGYEKNLKRLLSNDWDQPLAEKKNIEIYFERKNLALNFKKYLEQVTLINDQ